MDGQSETPLTSQPSPVATAPADGSLSAPASVSPAATVPPTTAAQPSATLNPAEIAAQVHAILEAAQQNAEEIERFARSEAERIQAQALEEAALIRSEAAAILEQVELAKQALAAIDAKVRAVANVKGERAQIESQSAAAELAAGVADEGRPSRQLPPASDDDQANTEEAPSAANKDDLAADARVVALNALLEGLSPAEAEQRLREHYPTVDAAAIFNQLRNVGR